MHIIQYCNKISCIKRFQPEFIAGFTDYAERILPFSEKSGVSGLIFRKLPVTGFFIRKSVRQHM